MSYLQSFCAFKDRVCEKMFLALLVAVPEDKAPVEIVVVPQIIPEDPVMDEIPVKAGPLVMTPGVREIFPKEDLITHASGLLSDGQPIVFDTLQNGTTLVRCKFYNDITGYLKNGRYFDDKVAIHTDDHAGFMKLRQALMRACAQKKGAHESAVIGETELHVRMYRNLLHVQMVCDYKGDTATIDVVYRRHDMFSYEDRVKYFHYAQQQGCGIFYAMRSLLRETRHES